MPTYNAFVGRLIAGAAELSDLSKDKLLDVLAEELDEGGWNSRTEARRERAKLKRRLRGEYVLYTRGQLVRVILEVRHLVAADRDLEIALPAIEMPVA